MRVMLALVLALIVGLGCYQLLCRPLSIIVAFVIGILLGLWACRK